MSYLELEQGIPDFRRILFSFWFRVPKQTLIDCATAKKAEEAKRAALTGDAREFYVYPRFHGFVPLITYGKLFEGYQLKQIDDPQTNEYDEYSGAISGGSQVRNFIQHHSETKGQIFKKVSKFLANPSFIGLGVSYDNDDVSTAHGSLFVRLQTRDNGTGAMLRSAARTVSVSDFTQLVTVSGPPFPAKDLAFDAFYLGAPGHCREDYVWPDGNKKVVGGVYDYTSDFSKARGPEEFEFGFVPVIPDHHHHALVSIDLDHDMKGEGSRSAATTPPCTADGQDGPTPVLLYEQILAKVTDPCKAWVAVDDVNYDLGSGDASKGRGKNDIACANINAVVEQTSGVSVNTFSKNWANSFYIEEGTSDATTRPIPNYKYSPSKIPSNGHPLGIPSTTELVDYIRHVEMAELQIFLDVTMRTDSIDNRRAFITDDGKPELDFSKARKLLGKDPEVHLHGSGKWIKGKNTGTLGIDTDGNEIKAGQFVPKAKILRYKPDPSLSGPQQPGEKKS